MLISYLKLNETDSASLLTEYFHLPESRLPKFANNIVNKKMQQNKISTDFSALTKQNLRMLILSCLQTTR